MATIGFIGMGNMGFAMLKGLLTVFDKSEMIFAEKSDDVRKRVHEQTGVVFAESNAECANNAKYLVLAVKPQYYDEVLKNIQYAVTPESVIISLAPGISIENLKSKLGSDKRIVRTMPNTPALLGCGMTGVSYNNDELTFAEKEVLKRIFESFGKYQVVEERLMNAVVCASGSSPAYVYMFIEALADSAVKYGLPRDKAYEFVAQTVMGAAKMVLETGEHPGALKDKVCSPGGTTIAGVAALEEFGFRNAIIKATDECYKVAAGIKK